MHKEIKKELFSFDRNMARIARMVASPSFLFVFSCQYLFIMLIYINQQGQDPCCFIKKWLVVCGSMSPGMIKYNTKYIIQFSTIRYMT
jgi:hypothetical protein